VQGWQVARSPPAAQPAPRVPSGADAMAATSRHQPHST
jgi:hypothetical protein